MFILEDFEKTYCCMRNFIISLLLFLFRKSISLMYSTASEVIMKDMINKVLYFYVKLTFDVNVVLPGCNCSDRRRTCVL